ncbi:hypothetical protein ALI144C_12325 [Actinosynnema sp. ALI-1.44]|uniref:hypothetical protein n=1 Tax=Actinosynnema sp. ALI-1.44 TaxID=1933779 RepID=UPI00097BFDB0|nr:hypothetical protein [Actinosynnema sp. ALI-1.44]ONI85889.1 hypothetical protein ALI144C_12325 [Actinosynnema sp. ALI-1.44]
MRKNTFFGSIALGIAGLALAAPMANAATAKGSLAFDADPLMPGDRVTLIARCDAPGFTGAKVDSTALAPSELTPGDQFGKGFYALAQIKKDIKFGTYPVSFTCGSTRVTANLTISDKGRKPATELEKTTTKPAPAKPAPVKKHEPAQVAVKPKGAADTGEGDVAPVNTAAPVQESGSNTGLYVLGGAGLLAAGGAGAFVLRRRSRA